MPRSKIEDNDVNIDKQELDDNLKILQAIKDGRYDRKDPELAEIFQREQNRRINRGEYDLNFSPDTFMTWKLFLATIMVVLAYFFMVTPMEDWDYEHFAKMFDLRKYFKE
ncbi:phosphatidylethanolamine N-methyltransferase [Acrasis kona]|uniref:Phosphatidylethanolamine N-methyltransferase n=1 Tax=Acrasis kona TaxID=1008807 RepID=A0AAW2ZE35_9EUKA